ncbi:MULTISPECIES: addiction module antidote protein [unclassified Campylobacter]|uniref:addiction module antidote protein n=1 Tax=unclassified Campylobacter TaxID=2593542 RepID=UPI003D32859F
MSEKFTVFRVEDFLTSDELRKEYLRQVLADGDIDELRRAIFYIAKSQGVGEVAKKANLNRESFYKMFKEGAKPRFESIFKVMQALDIKLTCA